MIEIPLTGIFKNAYYELVLYSNVFQNIWKTLNILKKAFNDRWMPTDSERLKAPGFLHNPHSTSLKPV
jgi:hypothetical protein